MGVLKIGELAFPGLQKFLSMKRNLDHIVNDIANFLSVNINNILVPQVLIQRLPNSLHLRHGTSLSHLTFSLEHSLQACRFRPRSRESGIAADPRSSHLLKWSRRTSL